MGKACETKIMNGNYIPYPASWIDISVVVKVITVNFMKKWSYLKVKFAQLLMLDTVKFTFLSMQNTVSIHPIFCRSSLNCHYDLSVPDLTECRRYFHDIRYTLYFLWWFLNVQMPEVEFKTKPRNKQKPSQICKCLVFFAGHSCTFSICVITSRNLVLVPAIIISLCDQIFSMGPRLPKIS